ncbi:hypothetical protein [Streptomyces sp. NPDC007172]|uniref:hypothetical protein n=1 Tax=Streptomyces sp. NPDC007172 TaxID=3364776 RepID=UPI003675A665
MARPRLLLVVCAGLLATGCVSVTSKPGQPDRQLKPEGGRLTAVSPGPEQWPAREALAPATGSAPTTRGSGAVQPPDGPAPDRPRPDTATSAHRTPVQRRAAARHPAPAIPPHHHREQPRPRYDPGQVCAWAKGTGFDPSVVRACQQQLGLR